MDMREQPKKSANLNEERKTKYTNYCSQITFVKNQLTIDSCQEESGVSNQEISEHPCSCVEEFSIKEKESEQKLEDKDREILKMWNLLNKEKQKNTELAKDLKKIKQTLERKDDNLAKKCQQLEWKTGQILELQNQQNQIAGNFH